MEIPTLEELKNRILSYFQSRLTNYPILQVSIIRILSVALAICFKSCYLFVMNLFKNLFVSTATDEYLDRLGMERGLKRFIGSYAVGSCYLSGSDGAIAPKGTVINSSNGYDYTTQDDIIIVGFGTNIVDIIATKIGAEYNNKNTPIDCQIVTPIIGVTSSCTCYDPIAGGSDKEENEEYRQRILNKIRRPPMGGNVQDYVDWAQENIGVDRAWCYRAYSGASTVATVITAKGSVIAPSALISDVFSYILTRAPVAAVPSVYPVVLKTLEIKLTLYPFSTVFSTKINELLLDLMAQTVPGTLIKISSIHSAISSSGVPDYKIIDIILNSVSLPVDEDIYMNPLADPTKGFSYPDLTVTYV